MNTSGINPILMGVAALAAIVAVLLYTQNSATRADLAALQSTRAAIESDAKAANERANVAERTIEEVKAEMARVQEANESVKHSVTQLRDQLDQVQIQANVARADFEAKLKSAADELAKAQADKQAADAAVARANEELAKERAAREAAQKAVEEASARAAEALAKERAARAASEGTSGSPPAPPAP
jgi:colicin import membrane protein